jgi:hypothetical protein
MYYIMLEKIEQITLFILVILNNLASKSKYGKGNKSPVVYFLNDF